MRLFLLGLIALTGAVSLANDVEDVLVAPVQFGPLDIDENSVRVVASRRIPGTPTYDIVLEFKILPKNTREENFAGLQPVVGPVPKLQAIYSHQGQPFKVPGKARFVNHRLTVTIGKGGMPLNINGATYGFILGPNEGTVQIHKLTGKK